MIAVTGATGQLGRLVINALLKKVPASEIIAAVRHPEKASDLAALGLQVRKADYSQPTTLDAAFQGVDKLLLISSSEVGQRVAQHTAVINAAKHAGVKLLAYTSLLHADKSILGLGEEHRATEALLRESGLRWCCCVMAGTPRTMPPVSPRRWLMVPLLVRWGMGVSPLPREDYAQAAAAVLTQEGQAGKVYELAGDDSYTLAEFSAEIARQSGKPVVYQDLSEADFKQALISAGLPEGFASMLADSDAGAAQGGLFDDSHTLSKLIGRPTTPYAKVIAATLATL